MSKFALVPDGFTLKKVSKAEEEAIKDHRRHEDVKTFLNNETTPLLIGGVALAAVTPILVNLILEFVEKEVTINEQQKTAIKAGIVGGALPGLVYQQLVKVDLNKIWEKVVVI